ncbi:MAG: hypothetical protein M3P29_05035, partial [Acidobacteriota bacterium]|nr:hypothetical protein [Acidobacteriota bacterium]
AAERLSCTGTPSSGVIAVLLAHEPAFTIVFDDDDTREAADVIAVRADDESLHVDFYHCKYSHAADTGGAWPISTRCAASSAKHPMET